MGARLGLQAFQGQLYRANPNAPSGAYADTPLIEISEWEQIVSWYENTAPEQVILPQWQPRQVLDLFDIQTPSKKDHDFPTTTAIYIDEATNQLLVGDSYELDLEMYSADLTLLEEVRSGGAISRILPSGSNGYLATTMGGNIGQSEMPLGILIEVSADKSPPFPNIVNRLVGRLHRPVDVISGDFNDDSLPDYVIAEFGAYAGKLSLHLSQADGTLREKTLLNEAGSISLALMGHDLIALIAQGDERIIRLRDFASDHPVNIETLMRFPPSQGSSSMKVLDFDGDGISDLLYTAGDNADMSPIFKPYHGVYLFIGAADGTFHQDMFFHLDGATNAVAQDFDLDGDVDIAAIAYYSNTDMGLDQTGFVYLQNTNGSFDPKYVEGIGALGRFVAISAGDIDGDGDQDIALANMAFGPYGPMDVSPDLQEQWLNGARFILLRNGLF